MVRFVTMQEHPVATRTVEPGKWVEDGLTAQQSFERERARAAARRPSLRSTIGSLIGSVARRQADPSSITGPALPRHLEGVEQAGCVVLHQLRTLIGGIRVDHLVVAPAGIFAVEDRPWRGQVAVSGDSLYVDGRLRSGVPESAHRTAEAVQRTLSDELAPLGVTVTPVLCLPTGDASWQTWNVQGVTVVSGRGLARHLRRAQPVMGRDTVVRLALAADRLFEHGQPAARR